MYFTHSLAGAVATKVVLDKKEGIFSKIEENILWIVGITASVLPDFDLVLYFLFPTTQSHREWISHSVVLYSILALVLFSFGFASGKKEKFGRQFFMSLATVFVFGVLSHLVLDYFVGGVVLFLPFSNFIYGYSMNYDHRGNWIISYVTSWYMLVEGAVLLGYLFFHKSIKNKVGRAITLFYVGLSTLAAALVGLFIA